MRRSSVALIALGLALLGGAVGLDGLGRRDQRRDADVLRALQGDLDSLRADLRLAQDAADSAAIAARLREKVAGMAEWEYHVQRRESSLEEWWKPLGPGTITVLLGLGAIGIGWATGRRP